MNYFSQSQNIFFDMLLYFCLEIFNILDSICRINLLTLLTTEIKLSKPGWPTLVKPQQNKTSDWLESILRSSDLNI